jgi:fructose-specific phosphotransferase system IIC component
MAEAASDADSGTSAESGFLTVRLAQLPLAARGILCFLGVSAGLFLCFVAIYGQRWLVLGRRKRDDSENQSSRWLRVEAGLTGIIVGGILAAYAVLLAILAGLSRSSSPSLGAWPLVIIPFVASILLGLLLSRWRWISRLALGIVGG